MKHCNSAQRKVCYFQQKSQWSEGIRKHVQSPNVVLSHGIIVVDKSNDRQGWVKVATVYSLIGPTRTDTDIESCAGDEDD